MAAMDQDKRKFLKHLGLLGFGALIGLGLSHATFIPESQIINNLSNDEIQSGRKRIWNDLKEVKQNLDPTEQYSIREGGGRPRVREPVCAYHYDADGDGVYEDSEDGNYCSMPCRSVCPVEAIKIKDVPKGSKKIPDINDDICIGCTKCFRICGYNAIEWINYPDG